MTMAPLPEGMSLTRAIAFLRRPVPQNCNFFFAFTFAIS